MISLNGSAPRFAANIRFIQTPDWEMLKFDSSQGDHEVGKDCSWLAGDADQFHLSERSFTDCIGPCSSGGLVGQLLATHPTSLPRVGLFHLIPSKNTNEAAYTTIAARLADHARLLSKPTDGLVLGGHSERHSVMLGRVLVGFLGRVMGKTPSFFMPQVDNAWSALGYDSQTHTWFVRTQTQDAVHGVNSVEGIRNAFQRIYVSDTDQVFIGRRSRHAIPKSLLSSQRVG